MHLLGRGKKVDEQLIKSAIGGGVRGAVSAARDHFSKKTQATLAIQVFLSEGTKNLCANALWAFPSLGLL